jgi:O-methyltransferase
MSDSIQLYIELLKNCVGNFIYDDDLDLMNGKVTYDPISGKYYTIEPATANPKGKYLGGIWPSRAHTMIGMPRLNNLQFCVEEIIKRGVPGDLIETGVWRGGAAIFMCGILKAYGITDRQVWVADSFEGLPPPDFKRYPRESKIEFHLIKHLAVSLEEVQKNFERYGLLNQQVKFLKGWFRDTLPKAPIKQLALMRLDGDMYESTMDALLNLYPKLSPGGIVIIDDYNTVQSCNDAVDTFRQQFQISSKLILLNDVGAFWVKNS